MNPSAAHAKGRREPTCSVHHAVAGDLAPVFILVQRASDESWILYERDLRDIAIRRHGSFGDLGHGRVHAVCNRRKSHESTIGRRPLSGKGFSANIAPQNITGYSAVGSALRSGRRGREFESH
jgi:hypothetical protein